MQCGTCSKQTIIGVADGVGMTVSKDTLSRDIYRAIITLLKNGLSDTQSSTRSTNSWVLSSFPDKDNLNRDDFPIVTVDKAEFNTLNKTLTKTRAMVTLRICVFSAGPSAASDCDGIADQVFHILNDAKYTTLRDSNDIYNFEVANITGNVDLYGSLKIHSKLITYNMDYVLTD